MINHSEQNRGINETREAQKQQVTALLSKHNIPIDQWGQGQAKTIDHLLEEISAGEIQLVENEAGELVRKTEIVNVDITYTDEQGAEYHLVEDKQVFMDGRTRQRSLPSSIAEKIKPGENGESAALRALQEELAMKGILELQSGPVEETTKISPSYPGLQSTYMIHHYTLALPKEYYRAEGYTEHQSDKTNYFIWEQKTK